MNIIDDFINKESASGILLICATILALIFSNSILSGVYESFLHIPVEIRVGPLHLDKSLYHWVNDGLMAIFFLLIGLEVKREVMEGELSSLSQAALPAIAAAGGMLVPAVIYVVINQNDSIALDGWAIPTATDIAFALGILSLLGNRVPVSLKIFLMALAIIDDLGAIIVIALLYTESLSMISAVSAMVAIVALITLNRFGVSKQAAYFIVGAILWVSVLKSGVHSTLAGIVLALVIPMNAKDEHGEAFSPAKVLEHNLHFWVAFFILPLFAFVNAGINVGDIALQQMTESVPLGIMLGLFIGKQLGVFGFSFIAIKLKWAELPKGCTWMQLYGVSVLTGIGFTMSLFISSLAFEDDALFQFTDKLAILLASFASGLLGYILLRYAKNQTEIDQGGTMPSIK